MTVGLAAGQLPTASSPQSCRCTHKLNLQVCGGLQQSATVSVHMSDCLSDCLTATWISLLVKTPLSVRQLRGKHARGQPVLPDKAKVVAVVLQAQHL